MCDFLFLFFFYFEFQFKCFIETCPIQFWNSKERNDHCLDVHKISKNFLQHYGNKYEIEITIFIITHSTIIFCFYIAGQIQKKTKLKILNQQKV